MRLLLLTSLLINGFITIHSSAQSLSSSLYFDTDQPGLSAGQQAKLRTFLKSLDTVKVMQLSVTTYCDDRGSDAYNQSLSMKRAEFMKQAISAALPGAPVEADGKGEVALTNTADPDATRSLNRRADILVTYTLNQQTPAPKPPAQAVATEEKKTSPSPHAITATAEKKEPIISDKQKVGDKITLENILFSGGRHILLPESYASLENLKDLLLEKKKYHIMILGHICCIRSGEDGMDFDTGIQNLSVERAKAVYNYLVQNGVSPGRLSYKGMRANYPTGKGDREDRRVEIEITKIDEK